MTFVPLNGQFQGRSPSALGKNAENNKNYEKDNRWNCRNWSSPEKVDSGSASYVCNEFWFRSPQVIGNPERCGAAEGYKMFRCNQRSPGGRFGYF